MDKTTDKSYVGKPEIEMLKASSSDISKEFSVDDAVKEFPAEGSLYHLSQEAVLKNQETRESAVRSYPRRLPIAISKSKGIMIQDTRGYRFFDCLSGAGALPLGYNHPELNAEIQQQFQSGMPYQSLDITTPMKDRFTSELIDFLPKRFAENICIQFCGPSGADAVEAALKLVKIKTGRRSIISFHGAYHGMTHGALSVTGNLNIKKRVPGLMPDVHFFPYPYGLRCPYGVGGDTGAKIASRYFESALYDPESGIPKPAGVILEIIQGEGGVVPAPVGWLQEIRRITREMDIPLIIDEIQTGISRTGNRFAFEHAGIIPDILLLSKAVGGGFPLSVMLYNRTFDCWQPGEHAGTFRGNQIGMATGCKTLQIIKRDNLTGYAEKMGLLFKQQLEAIQKTTSCIAEVRGRGLMLGIEIVKPDGSTDKMGNPAADPDRALQIQRAALQRGLILEVGGRNNSVIRMLPPLIIEEWQINFIASILKRAIAATMVF